jgi:hypothetical protein
MESVSGCLQMLLKCDWDGASGDVVSATRQAALRPRSEGLAFLERHVALPRFRPKLNTNRIQIAECHFSTLQMMQEIN